MKKVDWYLAFAWLLVFIIAMALSVYYIISNINSCTSQPLEYAVKQIKARFDTNMVYGTVHITDVRGNKDYLDFGDLNYSSFLK